MTVIDKEAPVLVTGGSGYIAGWIVKQLLDEGRRVHATVRDPKRQEKVAHLKKMGDQTAGALKLFPADLLAPASFAEAAQGCELIIHTASPFVISGIRDAQKELIDPALQGTRNVLQAVNECSAAKRVVLTSSVVAVYGDYIDLESTSGRIFTEEHWNTTSSLTHQPYNYSKMLAEKEAWAINKAQDKWDLVVVNPSLVLGPSLTRHSISASIGIFKQLGDGTGKFGVPRLLMPIVDVRDVARAHLNAGFRPEASGRHIVCAGEVSMLEMSQILRRRFGDAYPFPRREVPKLMVWLTAPMLGITREYVKRNVGVPVKLDNRYSIDDLGLSYRNIDDTLIDHFQQMVDDGLFN